MHRRVDAIERLFQIRPKCMKLACRRAIRQANENVIPTRAPARGQDKPCRFAQPPFGPVAGHGIPDFLGTGKANPDGVTTLRRPARAPLKNQAWTARFTRLCGRKEILPPPQTLNILVLDQAERLLRPRARRRARILRPFLVAIRDRKP